MMASAAKRPRRTLLRGGTVITLDAITGTEAIRSDLLIEDDVIAEVAVDIDAPDAQVIEAKGRLILPGMTNAHFHSSQNLLKGRYPGRPLDLLMLFAFPFDGQFRPGPELIYWRTLLTAMESLKRGVTTVLDDVAELPTQTLDQLDATFRAYDDVGMRACCSGHIINKPYLETLPFAREVLPQEVFDLYGNQPEPPTTEQYLEFSEEAVRRWHGRSGRLSYVVSPSGPARCTDDLLLGAAEFAERWDTPYHIHVLETKIQLIQGQQLYGRSLPQHLADIGALRARTTLAHAVWVDDEDIALLAEAGSSVAHNPICNLRIGSGLAPLRELLDAGVNVALGTDALSCNDSASLFPVMHTTGLVHNLSHVDYERWPNPAEIVNAAVSGGARSVCLENDIGSLEVGKQADLVVLDLSNDPFFPLNDPLVHFVYAEDGSSIERVMVAGQTVVLDGRVTTVDEAGVKAQISEVAREYFDDIVRWEAEAQRFEPHFRQLYERCMDAPTELDRFWANGTVSTHTH